MPDRPTFSQRQRTIDVRFQFLKYETHVEMVTSPFLPRDTAKLRSLRA
jgi:hypothetical protein